MDGWVSDGASISLRDLAPRGNRLELSFKSWRPEGVAPADLSFSVCGSEVRREIIDVDKSVLLYLSGSCEPRQVDIKVHNPFVASASDSRPLGSQLKYAKIYSALGPVLTSVNILFATFIAIFFLTLFYWVLTKRTRWSSLFILIPLFSISILSQAENLNLRNAGALAVLLLCLFCRSVDRVQDLFRAFRCRIW